MQGRPPMELRKALQAIFYVLRTGIQWNALPKTLGSSSAVHRYFRFWCEKGLFKALWAAGLEQYDEVKGINWTWLSGDGCMTKAPLALVVTGANRHDVSQLKTMLDAIVIERPDIFDHPQHVCLDKGYTGEPALEIVVVHGFIPHIRGRGEEKKERTDNPGHKARRWVVEVTHSWIDRFRKLLVRFEKLTSWYLGLLMFACAFIAFRKTDVI